MREDFTVPYSLHIHIKMKLGQGLLCVETGHCDLTNFIEIKYHAQMSLAWEHSVINFYVNCFSCYNIICLIDR